MLLPDMPSQGLEEEGYLQRLFSVPFVESFDISPHGRIAYFSNSDGQFQLYMIELDGSIARMTVDPERKTFPFFTSEDELVYFSDAGGNEKFDLYRLGIGRGLEKRTNVPLDITPGTDYAILPYVSYSADRRIASIVANRDGNFASYTMEKGRSDLKRITSHRYTDERADMSPDGRKVAVTALVSGQENAVFIVDLESGGVTAITDMEKREKFEASSPCWSPDGSIIAFKSAERGYSDIGLYDIQNGGITWLTEGTRECGSPVISPDGMKIAYTVNEGGRIDACPLFGCARYHTVPLRKLADFAGSREKHCHLQLLYYVADFGDDRFLALSRLLDYHASQTRSAGSQAYCLRCIESVAYASGRHHRESYLCLHNADGCRYAPVPVCPP